MLFLEIRPIAKDSAIFRRYGEAATALNHVSILNADPSGVGEENSSQTFL